MISREVNDTTVPSYKEICGGEKIRVYLGYNDVHYMQIVNDTLQKIPLVRDLKGEYSAISHNWEVLSTFFSLYNIEPIWYRDCWYSWGHYSKTWGSWTGCMGVVRSY